MKKLLSIILACSMLMSLCFVGTVHAGWEWVDFQYVETFDDGVVPEGYSLIKAANDEGSTLTVEGGELVFYAKNPWSFSYVVFNNLGKVKRDTNLVIEMDIRKISGPVYGPGFAAQVGAAWTINNLVDGHPGQNGMPLTALTTLDAERTTEGSQTYYQRELNPNDGSPYEGTATNLTGGNLASGEVVKVKYVFSQNNRNPKMFFNGVESNSDKIMWNNWTANEGNVGLAGMNGKFAIDNVVISGKKYALVPDYNSVVDYDKAAAAFTYEENFDDYANGVCPEGFKLKKADNDEGSTLSVQNGALEFYANNPWAYTYVAFENLGIVKRDTNLVIEMDLKKISGPKHAPGHAAQVGAAWTMAVEDGYKGSYVPVTGTTTLDAENTTEGSQVYYQREINPNDGSPYSGKATNFTGGNLASGEVVKVKYVFAQANRNAKVFFNGVESNSDKIMWNNWTANEGYVGLCGMNGKFAIDNIKITGYNYGSGAAEAGIEATTYEEYAEQFDTYKNEAGAECYTSAVKAAFNVSNLKNAVNVAKVWFEGADAAAEIKLNTAIESAKGVEIALNVRYVPTDVELTVEKIELN